MTKRFNTVLTLIKGNIKPKAVDVLIGHPCGYIAPASYLRKRPKASRAVAAYLESDASFSGDFELMLVTMALCGCDLPRSTWRHLKHWVSKGCPHWKNNSVFSAALVQWWNQSAWVFVPNRKESCQEALDAAEYYRDVVFENLKFLENAAFDKSPVNQPF